MTEILELTALEGLLIAGGTDYTAPTTAESALPNIGLVPMFGTSTQIPAGATSPNPSSR